MNQGVIPIAGACLIFGILGGSILASYAAQGAHEVPKYFSIGFLVAAGAVLALVAVVIGIWLLAYGVWTVVSM